MGADADADGSDGGVQLQGAGRLARLPRAHGEVAPRAALSPLAAVHALRRRVRTTLMLTQLADCAPGNSRRFGDGASGARTHPVVAVDCRLGAPHFAGGFVVASSSCSSSTS